MPSAAFIQSLMAKTRAQYGGQIVVAGNSYAMTTRSLEPREREYLPEGTLNAADADLRVFCTAPTDFPVWPALGSVVLWEGLAYTMIAVRPGDDVIGATAMKLEFFVYKKPAPDSATDATDAEQRAEDAATGTPDAPGAAVTEKRKSYSPVPSTL